MFQGDCRFEDCRPSSKGFFGEGSINVTDTVAIAGRVWLSRSNLTATRDDVAFAVNVRDVGVDGGVRVYGRPNDVRPFVQLMAGRTNVAASGRLGAFSMIGLAFSPGAGIEVNVFERAGLRVLGEWLTRRLEGERLNNARVLVGLMLTVGGR